MSAKNQLQRLVEQLKSGSIIEKRHAFERLRTMQLDKSDLLMEEIISAPDEHILLVLQGYDHALSSREVYEGTITYTFDQINNDTATSHPYWYLAALTEVLKGAELLTVEKLELLLYSDGAIQRAWAAYMVGELQYHELEPRLVDLLVIASDYQEQVRLCQALGKLRARRAVDLLLSFTRTNDEGVRRSAVSALANIGDPRAIEPLLQGFDPRGGAAEPWYSLISFGSKLVPYLSRLLMNPDWHDSLGVIIEVLISIGDHQAIEPLLKLLDSLHDKELKKQVIRALGELRAEQVVPIAASLLVDPSIEEDVLALACRTLGKIGTLAAENLLITQVRSPETKRKIWGAYGLCERTARDFEHGQKKQVHNIEALCELLQDTDRTVRIAAVAALRNLRDKRALPFLQVALLDTDDDVREIAKQAIEYTTT